MSARRFGRSSSVIIAFSSLVYYLENDVLYLYAWSLYFRSFSFISYKVCSPALTTTVPCFFFNWIRQHLCGVFDNSGNDACLFRLIRSLRFTYLNVLSVLILAADEYCFTETCPCWYRLWWTCFWFCFGPSGLLDCKVHSDIEDSSHCSTGKSFGSDFPLFLSFWSTCTMPYMLSTCFSLPVSTSLSMRLWWYKSLCDC